LTSLEIENSQAANSDIDQKSPAQSPTSNSPGNGLSYESSPPDEDEEEPGSAEVISDLDDAEFCKDTIYAQYLKDQYLKQNSKPQRPEQAFKHARKSRRGRTPTRSPYDQREVEALFFARSRMVGETVPYFGAIPVVTNPRVEHWIRFFKNSGRLSFLKWLVRGESVRESVLPILKDQGLPPEFIFLSMVESGFSNSAYSHAKATGPWQFMPGTARIYGLKMNMFIDERRDPAKSTLAAARHLRDLYEEFGDWYLAMAAYNAGPGRVRSAMRRTGSSNFWVLADSAYLPVETKNYVPKVLAALQLASNPSRHGFVVTADPLDALPVTTIPIKGAVELSSLSSRLGVPERLLRHWNPELVNAITPPVSDANKPYPLRLSPILMERWAAVEPQLTYVDVKDVLYHRIRAGETLGGIAGRYRVDKRSILSLNPGLHPTRLRIGKEVAIPVTTFLPRGPAFKKQAASQQRTQG
jgi:membrane-bound lytic murein transglycosylase D